VGLPHQLPRRPCRTARLTPWTGEIRERRLATDHGESRTGPRDRTLLNATPKPAGSPSLGFGMASETPPNRRPSGDETIPPLRSVEPHSRTMVSVLTIHPAVNSDGSCQGDRAVCHQCVIRPSREESLAMMRGSLLSMVIWSFPTSSPDLIQTDSTEPRSSPVGPTTPPDQS